MRNPQNVENINASGVMGIAYNPFLDSEAGSAYMNFGVAELLKFWTERIIEIDLMEKGKAKPRSVSGENARGDQRAALEQEGETKDGKRKQHVGH